SGPQEYIKLLSKNGNQWLFQRGLGKYTPQVLTTPIQLTPVCLARDDGFTVGVSTLEWVWDFGKDPHGLNADGTTVRVEYAYDHQVASADGIVGGSPWYDPNNHGLGYGILDGPSYGYPNRYSSFGPSFAGASGMTQYGEVSQEHPSRSQLNAAPGERKWFLDARPLSGPGPTLNDQA